MNHAPLIIDSVLARRLERTEAHANRSFVEARATLAPEISAEWADVGGTWAMFDGVDSPLTQTFGLGLFSPPDDEQLETIERFFERRGAAVFHEVSPMADVALLPVLAQRGYAAVEWSTVLAQPLGEQRFVIPSHPADLQVRTIGVHEADQWAAVAANGWSEQEEFIEFIRGIGRVSARSQGTTCFVAEREGVAIATGSLHLYEGVALLAGASTVPAFRRLGAQRALLAARLQFAREHGCDLAMMATAPGSDSQRNAQRVGFSVAYSRVKWGRLQRQPG